MAHAGTMDLGGSAARVKQSRRSWPVVVLTLVVVVATIAAVWFASSAGLVGGTSAKPAADGSYDAIEAQRGAATLTSRSQALDEHLNGILDRAHAAPYAGDAVTLSSDQRQALDEHLNGILDRAHATPYAGEAVRLPLSATSGTFHAGKAGDQQIPQAKRDRVGGP